MLHCPRGRSRSRSKRSMGRSRSSGGIAESEATPAGGTSFSRSSTRVPDDHFTGRLMTIKWVKTDPLVMNGEPFCYGSRLTVRQLLQERQNGADLTSLIKDHPELRTMGIAAAYVYAAAH